MRRASARTRGNFLTLFAFLLTVLLSVGAIAIDLSYLRNLRFQLGNAADGAAHAALVELRSSSDTAAALSVAQQVAAANVAGGTPVSLDANDVVFGGWDFDTRAFDPDADWVNAVRVRTVRDVGANDGAVNLFLAPAAGMGPGDAEAFATAAFRFRDMVIVQDITGSFAKSIDRAREADVAFLDYIHEQNFPRDRIGMVTFTGDATTWTPIRDVQTYYTATRAQWYGDGVSTYYTYVSRGRTVGAYHTKTAGLTLCYKPGYAAPYNAAYMQLCSLGGDYTNPGPGIVRGVDELLALGDNGNVKVIVFVSDGRPQCANASVTDACTAARIQAAYDAAAYAESNGIHTFVVSFCEGCSASQRASQFAFNERLVTGIGAAYETPTAADLPAILLDIASAIPMALVQ